MLGLVVIRVAQNIRKFVLWTFAQQEALEPFLQRHDSLWSKIKQETATDVIFPLLWLCICKICPSDERVQGLPGQSLHTLVMPLSPYSPHDLLSMAFRLSFLYQIFNFNQSCCMLIWNQPWVVISLFFCSNLSSFAPQFHHPLFLQHNVSFSYSLNFPHLLT